MKIPSINVHWPAWTLFTPLFILFHMSTWVCSIQSSLLRVEVDSMIDVFLTVRISNPNQKNFTYLKSISLKTREKFPFSSFYSHFMLLVITEYTHTTCPRLLLSFLPVVNIIELSQVSLIDDSELKIDENFFSLNEQTKNVRKFSWRWWWWWQ